MRSLTYLFLIVLPLGLLGCGGSSASDDGAPASYVPPGEKDDYYLFYSGGHSGQVFVAGLPSLREIQEIPVCTPSPGHGVATGPRRRVGKRPTRSFKTTGLQEGVLNRTIVVRNAPRRPAGAARAASFAVLPNCVSLSLMPTDAPDASTEVSAAEDDSGKARDLSLDEFQPYGTLAVTGAYFVLLLVLYALLYFVEFATHAPHIIE